MHHLKAFAATIGTVGAFLLVAYVVMCFAEYVLIAAVVVVFFGLPALLIFALFDGYFEHRRAK